MNITLRKLNATTNRSLQKKKEKIIRFDDYWENFYFIDGK